MKLTPKTLQVLKNFSSINQSIIINAGHELISVSDSKVCIAYAEIEEEFPIDFAIYDINKFINSINLLKDAEIEFSDDYLTLTNADSSIQYFYSDPDVLTQHPKAKFELPSVDIEYLLTADHMSAMMKASNNLDLPDVSIIADGKTSKLVVHNSLNKGCNKFSINLGGTTDLYTANFKIEYFKFLPGAYYMEISNQKISKFTNEDIDLTYFVALEHDSKF